MPTLKAKALKVWGVFRVFIGLFVGLGCHLLQIGPLWIHIGG
ncbi:hypothetical protein [Hamadaea sp.]|nr:hypothetical protein [Hamadaea sp.]